MASFFATLCVRVRVTSLGDTTANGGRTLGVRLRRWDFSVRKQHFPPSPLLFDLFHYFFLSRPLPKGPFVSLLSPRQTPTGQQQGFYPRSSGSQRQCDTYLLRGAPDLLGNAKVRLLFFAAQEGHSLFDG